MVAPLVPYVFIGGYAVDPLAVLRILLGLGTVWCYSIFSKRPESFIHHCEVRRAVFGLLTLAAAAEIIITALGVEPPAIVLLRRTGRMGAAIGIFCCSSAWKPLRRLSTVVVSSLLLVGIVSMGGIASILQVNGLDIHIPSLVDMVFLLMAIYNYSTCREAGGQSGMQDLARKFFLLSLLAAYVFRFVGVLVGMDLLVFMELAETLALAAGFLAIYSTTNPRFNQFSRGAGR